MNIEMILGIGLLVSVGLLVMNMTISTAIINRLKEKNNYYRSAKYRLEMFEQELALRNQKMKTGE
ncbi:hypothetical protein [uncultured Streptococcus sp.]|uniref:hypothetical protein n=1 Tax=uncultured Streptococcus sp. TaxID=83427 RepID=UPI0026327576|nr:hypothetical protein [uncultured Streptococcus sp.]